MTAEAPSASAVAAVYAEHFLEHLAFEDGLAFLATVGSTAVFVLYTALGGQFAVVRTDLLQYGLMVLGIPVVALACGTERQIECSEEACEIMATLVWVRATAAK